MKWVWISFFSVVLLLSVLFTAGFHFISLETQPSAMEMMPTAMR